SYNSDSEEIVKLKETPSKIDIKTEIYYDDSYSYSDDHNDYHIPSPKDANYSEDMESLPIINKIKTEKKKNSSQKSLLQNPYVLITKELKEIAESHLEKLHLKMDNKLQEKPVPIMHPKKFSRTPTEMKKFAASWKSNFSFQEIYRCDTCPDRTFSNRQSYISHVAYH